MFVADLKGQVVLAQVQGIANSCPDLLLEADLKNEVASLRLASFFKSLISVVSISPLVRNHPARQASARDAQRRWVRQRHIEHQGESRRIDRGRIQVVVRFW